MPEPSLQRIVELAERLTAASKQRPTKVDAADLQRLSELGAPGDVVTFYEHFQVPSTGRLTVHGIGLTALKHVIAANTDALPGYLIQPFGFIVVATSIFGDAFAIDSRVAPEDMPVRYVQLEDEGDYEGLTEAELREWAPLISPTFERFLIEFERGGVSNPSPVPARRDTKRPVWESFSRRPSKA